MTVYCSLLYLDHPDPVLGIDGLHLPDEESLQEGVGQLPQLMRCLLQNQVLGRSGSGIHTTVLQSRIHRPKIRNKILIYIFALSFLPDPEQIFPDPGKSSGSDRIRLHNTV